MKISNSKKELARIISENGGWPERALWAAQDNCIAFFLGGKPEYKSGDRCWYSNCLDGACVGTITRDEKVTNWHQTILSRDEYFHLYPAPDAEAEQKAEIRWVRGKDIYATPTAHDCMEMLKEKLGSTECGCDECSAFYSKPAAHAESTIEQLAADYRNKLDCANRKQDEADKANMESDAALSQLEDAIAAIGFVITPLAATEKEPELVAAVKVGDEVECVESNIKRHKYNGMVGRLHFIDESDTSTPYLVDFGGAEKIWCHEVKFIRRP